MTTAAFLSYLVIPVSALVIGAIMLVVQRRATAKFEAEYGGTRGQ